MHQYISLLNLVVTSEDMKEQIIMAMQSFLSLPDHTSSGWTMREPSTGVM